MKLFCWFRFSVELSNDLLYIIICNLPHPDASSIQTCQVLCIERKCHAFMLNSYSHIGTRDYTCHRCSAMVLKWYIMCIWVVPCIEMGGLGKAHAQNSVQLDLHKGNVRSVTEHSGSWHSPPTSMYDSRARSMGYGVSCLSFDDAWHLC